MRHELVTRFYEMKINLTPIKCISFSLLYLLLAASASLNAAETTKPNIVVFLADDMGWGDSATYGHPLIQTPNLDKLASQGVKFTQCYSACGVCSPPRYQKELK